MDKTLENLLAAERNSADLVSKAREEAARIADETQAQIMRMQQEAREERTGMLAASNRDLAAEIKVKENESRERTEKKTARIREQLSAAKARAAQRIAEELLR